MLLLFYNTGQDAACPFSMQRVLCPYLPHVTAVTVKAPTYLAVHASSTCQQAESLPGEDVQLTKTHPPCVFA